MPRWEYCILTRMSADLDTKWFANRIFQHHETSLPTEVTEPLFHRYNEKFEEFHATKVYPILPAILNYLGNEGWELIDDMNTGMAGGEGWLFKRERTGRATPSARSGAKGSRSAKKAAGRKR